MIIDYRDLDKYTVVQLVKIAVHNNLFDNSYYVSKKDIKTALCACILMGDTLLIPDTM